MWNKVYAKKQGCIVAITGKMGSGKTTLGVRFAELFDRRDDGGYRFPISEEVEIRQPDGYLQKKTVMVPRLIHSIDEFRQLRTRNYPMGTAFVIDEGQATLNNREWASRKNRFFNILMSTGRVFNSFIFITLPYVKTLDSQARMYLDAIVEVQGYDRKKRITFFKPGFVSPTFDYPIKFRIRKPNGRTYRIDSCQEMAPNKELQEAQDIKSRSWKENIPKGLVSSDGSILSSGVSDLLSEKKKKKDPKAELEEAHAFAKQWSLELKERRNDFGKTGKYSVQKITSFVALDKKHIHNVKRISELMAIRFREMDRDDNLL